jgi:glycosyltransferase involved in cell wall biosynthesis
MRVLMISPHPVYSPRGTPISVFNRAAALCALGHQVDLVTYPIGEDRAVDGLTYRRTALPGVHRVGVGPSLAKVALNATVAYGSLSALLRGKGHYDVVHTHEEAGILGHLYAPLVRLPHVYDMGNDWGVVLQNYGLSRHNPLVAAAAAIERRVVASAGVVIAHFPSLAAAIGQRSSTPTEVVYNVSLDADPLAEDVVRLRRAWSPDGRPVVVYTGTLEPYQGLPLLLDAIVHLLASGAARPRLVVVGGQPAQVAALRREIAGRGLAGDVHLTGMVASPSIPACLAAADVLVSPRATGSNTPLKIYAYLTSGTPVVATRIESHTQVLDDRCAVLVAPDARGLAAGIATVLRDAARREELARGVEWLRRTYSLESYIAGVAAAYTHVGGRALDEEKLAHAAARLRLAMGPSVLDATLDAPVPGSSIHLFRAS